MIFLEMSRVETHGGGAWAFPNCLWSPTEKSGGGHWPFWDKVLAIKTGDVVLHLRGVQPNAFFVGYSTASGNGFTTSKRPPDAGEWYFSSNFHRADLENYTPFHKHIGLTAVFAARRPRLEAYFDENKARAKADRRNIFFVRQSGRLQCLNGAYLSEIDDELLEALFGEDLDFSGVREDRRLLSIETSFQLREVKARVGQTTFSNEIKRLYKNECCFPCCNINDPRFLIGAHIARWSDNEKLRGHLGNGLCLCVFHDKAFELGLFTLDENYKIQLNPKELKSQSGVLEQLKVFVGQQIKLASVNPLDDALLEHWIRVDISP